MRLGQGRIRIMMKMTGAIMMITMMVLIMIKHDGGETITKAKGTGSRLHSASNVD
jgi:hypothetical protein